MPTPAISVVRRGEHPVDKLCESVGRVVFDKPLHLFRRRRQPAQIKREPPNQSRSIRLRGERETTSRFFQLPQQKSVDRICHEVRVPDDRHRRLSDRLKRPERSFFFGDVAASDRLRLAASRDGSLGNPALDYREFFRRNLLRIILARRHLTGADSIDQVAFPWLARFDRGSRLTADDQKPPQPNVESALRFRFLAVTLKTVSFQNRPHVPFERELLLRGQWERGHKKCEAGSGEDSRRHRQLKSNFVTHRGSPISSGSVNSDEPVCRSS